MTIAAANRKKTMKPIYRAHLSAAIQNKYDTDAAWHSRMADIARVNGILGGRPKGSVGRKKRFRVKVYKQPARWAKAKATWEANLARRAAALAGQVSSLEAQQVC
jgi:hypothetical protein